MRVLTPPVSSSPILCNAQHAFSVGRPATAWITGMDVVIVSGIQLKLTRTRRQAMFGSAVMLSQDQIRVTAPYTSYNHQSFLILRRKHKQLRCIQSTPILTATASSLALRLEKRHDLTKRTLKSNRSIATFDSISTHRATH